MQQYEITLVLVIGRDYLEEDERSGRSHGGLLV